MKTYNEYLKIIKDREYKEDEPRRKRYQEALKKGHVLVEDIGVGKMTVDYSVEIMGMMMQDFLNEIRGEYPFHFNQYGDLKVEIKEQKD